MNLTRLLPILSITLLAHSGALSSAPASAPGAPVDSEAATRNLIKNGSFERLAKIGIPEPWVAAQHAGQGAYHFTADAEHAHSGQHSLRIHRFQQQVYGLAEQIIPAYDLAGKRLRFTIWVRSENVGPEGAIVSVGVYESSLILAESRSIAITGNTDWTRFEMEIEVPPMATQVHAGISLHDAGTVWIDSAELVVIETAAAPTATAQ